MTNTLLHITSGDGPAECRIAVSRLVEIISRAAEKAGLSFAEVGLFSGDEHGPSSALFELSGHGATDFAKRYCGTVKFIFRSPVRPKHPRKNWFVSADVVEAASDVVEILEKDLVFETFRAGGPGGQHQNKTDSAVRVRHLPTGLSAVSRSERSQHRNKATAVSNLKNMLSMRAQQEEAVKRHGLQALNKSLERGNEIFTVRL